MKPPWLFSSLSFFFRIELKMYELLQHGKSNSQLTKIAADRRDQTELAISFIFFRFSVTFNYFLVIRMNSNQHLARSAVRLSISHSLAAA